jgi:hypothetical protein
VSIVGKFSGIITPRVPHFSRLLREVGLHRESRPPIPPPPENANGPGISEAVCNSGNQHPVKVTMIIGSIQQQLTDARAPAAKRRQNTAHGVSRGRATRERTSPGGAKEAGAGANPPLVMERQSPGEK